MCALRCSEGIKPDLLSGQEASVVSLLTVTDFRRRLIYEWQIPWLLASVSRLCWAFVTFPIKWNEESPIM